MIDIHCHIVPNFDDGPSSLAEAMEMIDMGYEDGIREFIATSHRNHRLDFKPKETYKSGFEKIYNMAKEKYQDIEIYMGSELYIGEDYLELFDSIDYDFTLNRTRYVLLEFPREVNYDHIMDVVHEFKVRGYIPVLAHIEMYESLMENLDGLKALKTEGAYLQITGSSLIGKQGKPAMNRLRDMVKNNYIDFIASDGHTPMRRRLLLSKSYNMVARDCSEEVANRIFIENPELLISGEVISPLPIKHKRRRISTKRLNLVASVAAIFLIAASGLFAFAKRDSSVVNPQKSSETDIEQDGMMHDRDENIATDSIVDRIFAREKKEDNSLDNKPEEDKDENLTSSLDNSDENIDSDAKETSIGEYTEDSDVNSSESNSGLLDSNSEIESSKASKNSIVSKYRSKLSSLESSYESQLASKVSEAKNVRNTIDDPVKRNEALEKYADEISALESSSDNRVYSELYNMQNELEAGGYDVSAVEQFRSEYNSKKSAAKSRYLE